MRKSNLSLGILGLASVASALLLFTLSAQAQSTPSATKIDVLGTGTESLMGGDLTDPENDGVDEAGAATDPSWNWANIDASVEPDFQGGENAFNVFDNILGPSNDKWCCDDPQPDNPVWVAVQFKQVVSLTHFTVSSANDVPDRDPIDWAIQGSNDKENWKDIYHFKGDAALWTERLQVIKFTLPAPSEPYTWFRYIAYDTPGSLHQIGEIEYFGIVGGVTQTDTDKDGMPDKWETDHGFNPNDPSDAAKDFDGDGVSNLDEYKAGSDPTDVTKPTVVSVAGKNTLDTVKITFSENLDPTTATNVANYTITPTLGVTAAAYKGMVVTLTTATQKVASTYTIALKGVKDLSKNEVAAGTTATLNTFVMTKEGLLKWSYWGDATGGDPISGTAVQGLLDDPRYPASPDLVAPVYSFNSRDAFPDDTHENFGATMEGYITPKETASYNFFLSSDDASQLWLSTDDTEANLKLIAEETGCCQAFLEPDTSLGGWHDNGSGLGQTTLTPISLTAGKKYFVRLIYKEGGGGDYAQVAWRKVGDTTAANKLKPITSEFLSSTVDLLGPPAVATSGSKITYSTTGKTLSISWSPAGGTLQSAPSLGTGATWTDVGTANPASITIGTGTAFYRVKM